MMRIVTLGIIGLFFVSATICSEHAQWGDWGPTSAAYAQENVATTDSEIPLVNGSDAKVDDDSEIKIDTEVEAPEVWTESADRKTAGFSTSTIRSRETRDKLKQVIDFEYQEVPFVDVRHDLEDKLGVNIVLDASAIDDALTDDELISVRLRGVSAANSLRLALHSYNATYVVGNDVVRIISIANIGDRRFFSQRMINVQTLLELIMQSDSQDRKNSATSEQHDAMSSKVNLVQTITNIVSPDLWELSGKGEAVIEIIGGVLVMRGPEGLLDEVSDFLKDLEAELSAAE